MKKLLALLLLAITLIFTLTSCATADDIAIKADNAASMLEFNFYKTLKITSPRTPGELKELVVDTIKIDKKNEKGDSEGSITVYTCNDEASAALVYTALLPDATEKKQPIEIVDSVKVAVGKLNELIPYTLPDGMEELVIAEKPEKDGSVKQKITIYYCDSATVAQNMYDSLSNNAEGLDVGISGKEFI